jgi:hypothetical protein
MAQYADPLTLLQKIRGCLVAATVLMHRLFEREFRRQRGVGLLLIWVGQELDARERAITERITKVIVFPHQEAGPGFPAQTLEGLHDER